MPKREIDYSTRMIYFYKFVKIDDPSFIDCYVGHTINIIDRKYNHRRICHNPNSKNYNSKIYKTIRDNGGWDNWKMLVIHQQICKNDIEARQIEQKFIEELGAKMNTLKAYRSEEEKKKYYENNKEKYKENNKEYYENNKEQRLEYQKEYYENNKQKISEQKKTYYENNKEQHKKLLKNWYNKNKNKVLEKYYCECGGIFSIQKKLRHERTLKHQAYCLS
jgi:hypothetical protein